jgi:N6-L-threonylcarbamoyladenine synthase
LDDACGEAFDKVAKILGLGYPGGPLIERLAKDSSYRKIKFSCSNTQRPLDFSFSGIKTAVLYTTHNSQLTTHNAGIAASFQESVIETLIRKAFKACELKKTKRLVIGGGVVRNKRLRERFNQQGLLQGIRCFFPSSELCMDNAAMVAGLGYQLYKKGHKSGLDLSVELSS